MNRAPRRRRELRRPAGGARAGHRAVVLGLAAWAVWAAPARGQQIITEGDEPADTIVIGERQKLPKFYLERPRGYIETIGTYTASSAKPVGLVKNENNEFFIQERFTLDTAGYIVHPNLVSLRVGATLGLVQDWNESTGGINGNQSNQSNNYLTAWNVSADLFRNQSVNGTLYTDRTDNFVDQSFGPTLYETTTTYGGLVNIQSKSVPTQLRAYHMDQTQSTGFGDNQNFDISQDVFQWHSEARPTSNQFLTWDYNFNHTDQTAANGLSSSSDSHALALGHSVTFGKLTSPSTLDSTFQYTQASGLLANTELTWNELLRLRHTENFETNYEYRLDQRSFEPGIDQTLQRGTAGFRHQLYKSLTTIGRAGVQDLTLSDGSESRDYFGNLNLDYRKQIPKGLLQTDLGLTYDQQTNTQRSQEVQVIDQAFSFTNFQPFTVIRTAIVPASVVIRDATGQVYQENVAYRVHPRPDGIEISRIPGGGIPDNDPLLLSYNLGATPAYDVTTSGLSTGMRYTLKETWLRGLSPYVRFGMTNQSVSGGSDTIQPNDVMDYIQGVDYFRNGLRLRYEHETYDSTIYPFDANRFEMELQTQLNLDTRLTVNGTYTMLDYQDPALQTDTASLSVSLSRNIMRNLTGTITGSWVNVTDSDGNESTGFQEALEIRWQQRLLEVYARVRNSNLDSNLEDRSFQFFQVGLRRSF